MKPILRVIIIFISATYIYTVNAQERTISDVIDEVYSFLASDSVATKDFGNSSTYKTQMQVTRITRDTTTYFYAVNMPDGGWAIVSNEQRYNMIIGYSMDSHFDTNPDNQPDALKLILELHMDRIDSLRELPSTFYEQSTFSHPFNGRYVTDTILLKHNGIENRWRQRENNGSAPYNCDKVYNKFCPPFYNVSCGRTKVGCTAVSMAQLAWYWHWPDYAEIHDSIDVAGVPQGPIRKHYYDWDNMPTTITDASPLYQVNMVAGLLRDCGFAAWMLYAPSYSLAGPVKLKNALEDIYHFHVNTYFDPSNNTIAPILQYELQQKRPVLCVSGKLGDEVHTFAIDGYSPTNNTYHVNWGWGWDTNGWYDINLDGYNVARTFFTEIYPDCSEREESVSGIDETTIASGEDITLYSANDVSLDQLIVANDGHLNVSVGGTITLGSGFQAQLGSAVKLTPNYNCTTGSSLAPVSFSKHKDINKIDDVGKPNLTVFPNPAVSEINIHCEEMIKKVSLFNINGQEVLQTTQTEIDISHLPNGIYIICATTKEGEILQRKLIHK